MPFLQAKQAACSSSPTPDSPKRGGKGAFFGAKLTQTFWKSRSKTSVGSESQGSMSTISGLGSPPFTPDSSLSIYTNSLDSDCSNSSTNSNSNQISPIQNGVIHHHHHKKNNYNNNNNNSSVVKAKTKKKPSNLSLEDQISPFSYNNDCQRYAANMYYDMGDSSSFECRFRNTYVPQTLPFEEDDGVHSYYNNSTFTTFPNPRRHSCAYSSCSSSLTSNASITKHCSGGRRSRVGGDDGGAEEMIELLPQGPDGYLIPISGSAASRQTGSWKSVTNNKKNLYMNESAIMMTNEIVQVDVHTSAPNSTTTTTDGLNTTTAKSNSKTIEDDLNSSNGGGDSGYHHQKIEQRSSSSSMRGSRQASNDSDSTTTIVPTTDDETPICSKDRILPLYMSRILAGTSDCEPFCSLCATSVVITPSKSSKMDVAIISCQECFFSRVAEKHIHGFFDRMVTNENQKLDIVLQAYDLKDLDHHAVAAEVHRAKVQIVIISNHFLDRLRHEASSRKKLSPVNRVLRSKRVIAVIASTGTTAAEISEGYQAVLARFDEWFTVELRSTTKLDAEFCKKFTDQVVKIYNVELSNASNFSVFPKKVTKEQPKIVIMLKKPVEVDEQVRIELTRGRDMETLTNVTITNPYTVIIRIPESFCANKTALLEITLHINQRKLGTKLVKYEYNAKNTEDDVIDHMGKTLPGFLKTLDDHISQTLSKNFRACTDWTLDPDLELLNDALISKGDDFPTPMHFAAFYGLEQTVWTLLDEADGLEQCSLPNDVSETPVDIAQGKIVQIIKDYQEMTVTWKAFQYVKDLVDRKSEQNSRILSDNTDDADSTLNLSKVDNGEDNDDVLEQEGEEKELHYPMLQTMAELDEEMVEDSEKTQEYTNDTNVKLPSSSSSSVTENQNGYHLSTTSTEASSASYVNIVEDARVDVNEQTKIVAEIKKDTNMSSSSSSPKVPTRRKNPLPRNNRGRQDRHSIQCRFSGMVNVNREGAAVSSENNSNPCSPLFQPEYTEVDENPIVPKLKPKPNNFINTYDVPRLENQEYKIPPSELRPVLPEKSATPTSVGGGGGTNNNNNTHNSVEGYLIIEDFTLKSNGPSSELFLDHSVESLSRGGGGGGDLDADEDEDRVMGTLRNLSSFTSSPLMHGAQTHGSSSNGCNPPIKLDPTDEELVLLMNDYKNNVYSMRQLELLFAHWKERADVKLSYKERNEHLQKMRDEYKVIQERMQKNHRRPSILTKFLINFFGSRKKSSTVNPTTISEANEENDKLMTGMESDRKLYSGSGNSDRQSVESGNNSGDSSSTKSDILLDSTEVTLDRTPVWVHPLSQKCDAGNYVPPTLPSSASSSSPQPPVVVPTSEEKSSSPPPSLKESAGPPPRPSAKKPSVSPPSSFEVTRPAPSIAPKFKGLATKTSDLFGGPPTPPPRNTTNSPFNLINYNSRNQDQTLCPTNGAPKPNLRQPYVNGDVTLPLV